MEEILLDNLLPSFLIFSSISFSLFFTIPKLKLWLKQRFEELSIKGISGMEFFTFQYYFAISRFIEFVVFPYLIATFMIVLLPLIPGLKIASYYLIVFTTTILLGYVFFSIPPSIRKALKASILPPPL